MRSGSDIGKRKPNQTFIKIHGEEKLKLVREGIPCATSYSLEELLLGEPFVGRSAGVGRESREGSI